MAKRIWPAADIPLFLLSGGSNNSLEEILVIYPSIIVISKCTPPGVEGSMVSLTVTIILISYKIFKSMMGVFINSWFVGVSRSDMSNYQWLPMIQIVSAMFPLILIHYLVPKNEDLEVIEKENL